MTIQTSANFKKQAFNSVLSIFLFVLTYLILIALALALTAAVSYAGFMLLVFKVHFLTLMIAIGLFGMGLFIVIFLFKFITKKHKIDRSLLVEITAEDEPKLFAIINDVISEVKTNFPKKVYLSHDVNASVFYNSTFWSMFFPVRKNLQIGVGLINAVTVSEFKAILAHEFGHFSQRSMKVGSYVYNVNQVIYNLLFENDSYNSLLSGWASASSYFTFFAKLATKIIEGIQWILRKVYTVVNLNYLSLSREMEFHADEVAAHVTGPKPMINSLLRLGLADQSFSSVLNYYSERIDKSVKASNVYTQHAWLMKFLGAENNIAIESALPHVTIDDISRFNKSKLVIKDQWSSHPTTQERVEHLQSLHVQDKEGDDSLASTLFIDKDNIQARLTGLLFENIEYKDEPVIHEHEKFIEEYRTQFHERGFDNIYNGYYDNKYSGLETANYQHKPSVSDEHNLHDLVSADKVDMIYTASSMEADIETIKEISTGKTAIKTFDYDGQRYSFKNCDELLVKIDSEIIEIKKSIEENDRKLCMYFLKIATQQGKPNELMRKVESFNNVYGAYQTRFDLYNKMVNESAFMQETTPYDAIDRNLLILGTTEKDLKNDIKKLMDDADHVPYITSDMRESFRKYCFSDLTYFSTPDYDSDAIGIMYLAMNNYLALINDTVFKVKKVLLDYQFELIVEVPMVHSDKNPVV